MAKKCTVFLDIDIIEDEKAWTQQKDEYERAATFVKSESSKYGFSSSDIAKLTNVEKETLTDICQSGNLIFDE
jgi:hypothetical protein